MNTSALAKPKFQPAYVPTTALAKAVTFTEDLMQDFLVEGRVIGVPLVWFPRLRAATPAERAVYEIGGGGISLYWPEIDEELSVAHLLAGADWRTA